MDGEEEALLRERNMLEHAESVRDACAAAYHALSEGDRNAADLAAEALDHLRRAQGAAEALAAQVEALESALAQLSDVAREVRNLAESVESDPVRLAEIEERVELLRRLKRKYGGSESAVLAFAEDAPRTAGAHRNGGRTPRGVASRSGRGVEERGCDCGRAIGGTPARGGGVGRGCRGRAAGGGARARVVRHRSRAGRGGRRPACAGRAALRLLVERDRPGSRSRHGRTPARESRPLAKVASGGETSRMMLALNSALQTVSGAPSLVFDEIDAGIGSRAGEVVGRKLWAVGQSAGTGASA